MAADYRAVLARCDYLERDNATLISLAPEMREALLGLEWSGAADGWTTCPVCDEERDDGKHAADCKLAALLDKLR